MAQDACWIGICPACGPVEVVVVRARLTVADSGESVEGTRVEGTRVEFDCPSCGVARSQPVDGPTAEMFQAMGAEVGAASPAEKPVEPAP